MIAFCSGIETGLFIRTGAAYAKAANRFVDPADGFFLAISYGYWFTIAIASESSAAALFVSHWTETSPAVVISTEVVTGFIKVACFPGVIIVSIVITSGRAPYPERIELIYLYDPGAWTNYNGIGGRVGRFSIIGVETVVLGAAESIDSPQTIFKAASWVTHQNGLFYVLDALLIGLIVDPQDEDLVSGPGDVNSSPWVIAIMTAGLSILPSIVNACILVSAWSAERQLPRILGGTTRQGVPWVAVTVSWLINDILLGLGTGGASQAFMWFLSLSVVAGLIAWATLCFCYVRFHRALKFGFAGSSVIIPITGFPMFSNGNWSTANFVASYTGISIFVIPIIEWKLVKKTKVISDLNT
ncbi:hypothetical protein BJ170DRAFT_703936 [Xylariales sp. AK1849]|nr:hypothetical protein BJ170DRAFT_703936 [Xylariales sp. AK1849]